MTSLGRRRQRNKQALATTQAKASTPQGKDGRGVGTKGGWRVEEEEEEERWRRRPPKDRMGEEESSSSAAEDELQPEEPCSRPQGFQQPEQIPTHTRSAGAGGGAAGAARP